MLRDHRHQRNGDTHGIANDLDREETQIRELIEDWADAARAKNVDAIFAHYAPDILAFGAIGQLQFKGADAYRKHCDACMSMCPGQMVFEVHDLEIETQGDLAFGHYLSPVRRDRPDGKERSGWLRATFCCRKTNGSWRIVHEHFSAPFDLESGEVLDLRP